MYNTLFSIVCQVKWEIFAGSSSGAALIAAKKLIDSGARGNVVVIFPDRGDRYFTKNFMNKKQALSSLAVTPFFVIWLSLLISSFEFSVWS